MSNFSTFFPSGSGSSGGGGGILKQHRITTSGTLDLTTLGIADGDTIGLIVVGGGSMGYYASSFVAGGSGGGVWKGSVTIGTAGTVTATIGAGGTSNNGFPSILSGGGLPIDINTGNSYRYDGIGYSQPLITPGTLYNGMGGYKNSSQDVSNAPGSGIDGYGIGGTASSSATVTSANTTAYVNSGRGGDGNSSASSRDGFSGVIIIFY
jgi:hypothetical protein|tara:strand:- start:304 stop:927 length:624 start_codon:yes stop_codon:yes gene_type:complete